jgi:hypothetical protein
MTDITETPKSSPHNIGTLYPKTYNFTTQFHRLTNTLPLFDIHPEVYADANNLYYIERLVLYSVFDSSIPTEAVKKALQYLMIEVGEGSHTDVTNDMIPSHYTDNTIEPIEFMVKNNLFSCEANVVKYISRYKTKNKAKDLVKCWYYFWVNRYGNYDNIPNIELDNKKYE